ncbi:MAG: nucleoside-diphosphate kinase [Lentimicrobium sp.]|jgi:nucleoside-diphosphate kinase|nr:nucleoside-diphosphate kinase [Lentimicrobium sp.]MDD2526814.1 nucleoside-diphosphate kinase [Lentimicrobiaceae bacterium]MDD4597887.1 nucleoside-diphosphate kinase [Lentimicrobiaceae bacterium]MDY0024427.1 nucleoside-diphosphate kinase [Lentimicrobium sp.]HAH58180.1 nucleoside-diphosphate kinase [Bacteroidales bacterium]
MKGNLTFTMIKPSAVQAGHSGKILDMIITAGFNILAIKKVKLSSQQAGKFYEVHKERPFYNSLVSFMSSGAVYAAVLEKEDAVNAFRKLIGATNPMEAEEGTVRKMFGASLEENAVHGSDSDENALIESHFFFSDLELM